ESSRHNSLGNAQETRKLAANSLTHALAERYARKVHSHEREMTLSDVESPEGGTRATQTPPLPQIWVGYLLGVATIVAELVAVGLNPQLAKEGGIPPLYLFLVSFVGGVYWLVCIYRIHVVLAHIPEWKHPISPARAVGFHFIPFYQFYWVFK